MKGQPLISMDLLSSWFVPHSTSKGLSGVDTTGLTLCPALQHMSLLTKVLSWNTHPASAIQHKLMTVFTSSESLPTHTIGRRHRQPSLLCLSPPASSTPHQLPSTHIYASYFLSTLTIAPHLWPCYLLFINELSINKKSKQLILCSWSTPALEVQSTWASVGSISLGESTDGSSQKALSSGKSLVIKDLDYIAPSGQDLLLTDATLEILSNWIVPELYLSASEPENASFPVTGILYGSNWRLMVNLSVGAGNFTSFWTSFSWWILVTG